MRWLALPFLLVACQKSPDAAAPSAPAPPAAPPPAAEPPVTESAPAPASIGSARMEPDGTIVLQLRASGPVMMGDALLRYPPGHEKYQYVLDHLGGLQPGESKPVPPFPD